MYLLLEDQKLDPCRVLKESLPDLHKSRTYLPIFKFINESGITSQNDAVNQCQTFKQYVKADPARYQTKNYLSKFNREWANKSSTEIIEGNSIEAAAYYLVFQTKSQIDIDVFKQFLVLNFEGLFSSKSATPLRKAACYYDFLLHCPW